MRLKRSIAFLLAFLMLFSETSTAFAADVSGGEEMPFELSKEDDSQEEVIDVTDNMTENAYDAEELSFTLSEGSYKSVYYYKVDADDFKIAQNAKALIDGVEYPYFDNVAGGELYNYSDVGELTSAVDKNHQTVETDEDGNVPVGSYYMPVKYYLDGKVYTYYAPIEVKSLDKAPVASAGVEYSSEDSGREFVYKLSCRQGYSYVLRGKCDFSDFSFTLNIHELIGDEENCWYNDTRFVAKEGAEYYLVGSFTEYNADPDAFVTFELEESKSVKKLEIEKMPYKTSFYYGLDNISNFSFDGLTLKATMSDDSVETMKVVAEKRDASDELNYDFFEFLMPVNMDKYHYYPIGKYDVKISVDDAFVIVPIEIVSPDNMPEIGFDAEDPLHVKSDTYYGNICDSHYARIDVSGGENVRIYFDKAEDYTYNPYVYDINPRYVNPEPLTDENVGGWAYYIGYDNYAGSAINLSSDVARTYYIKFKARCDVNVYAEKVVGIKSIEVDSKTVDERVYEYFSNKNLITPLNTKLKVTYTDGSSKILSYQEFDKNGIRWGLTDGSGNEISSENKGDLRGYRSGDYRMSFISVSNADVSCNYIVTVKEWDDIPELKEGTPVFVGHNEEVYRNDRGEGTWNYIGTPVYYMDLKAGEYCLSSEKEHFGIAMYDLQGKKVCDLRNWAALQYFKVENDGRYYVTFNCEYDLNISLAKASKPKEIKVITQPSKRELRYGFDEPSVDGIKLRIVYSDGTSKDYVYGINDFSNIFNWTFYASNGEYGFDVKDINHNYPVGDYYFRFWPAGASDVYVDVKYTVVPLKPDYMLSPAKSLSLKNNMYKVTESWGYWYSPFNNEKGCWMTPYLVGVNMIEGETYRFSIDSDYREITVYGSDCAAVSDTLRGKGFNYTAKSTGLHYLKVYTNGGTLSVNPSYAITGVTVLSGPYNNEHYAGTINNGMVIYGDGLSFLLDFANGDTIECDAFDETWYAYGMDFYYPCDISGNSVKESLYNEEGNYWYDQIVLEPDKDYYIKPVVPSYEGTVDGIEKLKFTARSVDSLKLTAGEKFYVPRNKEGYHTGSEHHFVDLEKGKTYRFTSNFGTWASVYDENIENRYGGLSGYRRYEEGSVETFIYTATKTETAIISYGLWNQIPEGTYLLVEEIDKPVSAKVTKAPSKLKFEYGVSSPFPMDVEITIKYESGAEKIVSYEDFNANGIEFEVYTTGKKVASYDKNWNRPKGTYIFGYEIKGIDGICYDTDNQVKVVSCDKNYKVIFNSNYPVEGLTNKTKNQTIATNKSVKLTANPFSCKGYSFEGWALSEDGEAVYSDKVSVYNLAGEDASVKLFAKWKVADYKMTWHLSGGSFIDGYSAPDFYTMYSETVTIPSADKLNAMTGFEFAGWYTTADYRTEATDIATGSVGDRDFYAKWKPAEYTIKFDGNGNDKNSSMSDQTVRYGITEKLNKVGYKDSGAFMGWAFEDNKDTVVFKDKETINIADYLGRVSEDGVLTLYAVWRKDFYISFNLDGGEFKDSEDIPAVYTYGKNKSLPKPSKTGHTFVGWYDSEEKKVSSITKTTSGDLYLFAHWSPVIYGIKYDGNGGSGKMKNVSATYGTDVTIPECGYTKKGYEFKGWIGSAHKNGATALKEDEYDSFIADKTIYLPGQVTKNLTSKKENVKLCAVWVRKEYTVTYNSTGGTSVASGYYYYNSKKASFTLASAPEREGYTFAGWYFDADYKKKVTSTKGLYGNLELFAKWTAPYTVEFYPGADDATGSMNPQTMTFSNSQALSENKFRREGYAFVGWDTDAAAENVVYTNKQKIKGKDDVAVLKLYAVWKNEFSITYNVNGGELPTGSSTSYRYGKAFTLPTPVRSGYSFGGWYSDTKFKKKLTEIKAGTGKDMEIFAKWTGLKYTVTFNANAPEGTTVKGKMKNQSLTWGTAKALTKNAYKIKGYTFKGWARSKYGSPVIDNAGKATAQALELYSSDIVLYAVWERDEYSVIIDMGDVVEDSEFLYNVDETILFEEPERIGYTFLGFYSDKKFKKKVTGIKAGTTGNKKFYAKWKVNK